MKIIVPKFSDPRERSRFISDPLSKVGHQIECPSVRSFREIIGIFHYLSNQQQKTTMVLIGSGIKVFLITIVGRLTSTNVIIRLGGNTLVDAPALIKTAFHNFQLKTLLRTTLNLALFKTTLRLANSIIVVNPALGEDIKLSLEKKTKIHIVPQPGKPVNIHRDFSNKNISKILTVTNLKYPEKAKGVIWQINTLAALVERSGCKIDFKIAGGGTHANDIADFLEKIKLPQGLKVTLLGFLENLEHEYRAADIFVYRSNHDGTPNVLLEAKRWQLPVVVNSYLPLTWLVEHNNTGLVYQDENGFIDCVLALIMDKGVAKLCVDNATLDYEARFMEMAIGEQLSEIILDQ